MELKPMEMGPLTLHAEIEQWPMTEPFRITGHTWEVLDVVLVRLEKDGHVGCGEGDGVYYHRNEDMDSIIKQIEAVRTKIEAGISRDALQRLLPPGGARNALDCALWDLEAKLRGIPAWHIAGLEKPRPLRCQFAIGAEEPEHMAATARSWTHAKAIKLKMTGEPVDAERVRAVRKARPEVWLSVDANQGLSRASLERLMPVLTEARVYQIEQPFPVGEEALLDGLHSPIPIAADESVQDCSDIPGLVGRFQVVNIKLDKSGGLTEGLAMARAARAAGLDTMIGCMTSTSLAMAPAFLVGQLCSVVELDGPVYLKTDRANPVQYTDGFITCPKVLWG